jgi:hypothetical protein
MDADTMHATADHGKHAGKHEQETDNRDDQGRIIQIEIPKTTVVVESTVHDNQKKKSNPAKKIKSDPMLVHLCVIFPPTNAGASLTHCHVGLRTTVMWLSYHTKNRLRAEN